MSTGGSVRRAIGAGIRLTVDVDPDYSGWVECRQEGVSVVDRDVGSPEAYVRLYGLATPRLTIPSQRRCNTRRKNTHLNRWTLM